MNDHICVIVFHIMKLVSHVVLESFHVDLLKISQEDFFFFLEKFNISGNILWIQKKKKFTSHYKSNDINFIIFGQMVDFIQF